MVIIGNRLNIFSLAMLFFICSCETVSDWTDSIGSDLSEVDPSLGEILADVESEDQIQNVEVINEEDLEILSPEENKEDDIIVDVEEKLPPVPQQLSIKLRTSHCPSWWQKTVIPYLKYGECPL